jgi:hypothetical protein
LPGIQTQPEEEEEEEEEEEQLTGLLIADRNRRLL